MNKPLSPKDVTEPKVTTGPLSGSRKIYSSPDGPCGCARAVARDRAERGGAVSRVYDTSGPYTDPDAEIDVKRGLPPCARLDRGARRVEATAASSLRIRNVGEAHRASRSNGSPARLAGQR